LLKAEKIQKIEARKIGFEKGEIGILFQKAYEQIFI